jgi:thymidylate kinase
MSAAIAHAEPRHGPLQTSRGALPLPLVIRLSRLLEESQIVYCHWKSNAAIDRSASGENDLDLLVRRSDVVRFTELLSALGFKRVERRGPTVPGIESFYGFDSDADRLLHVHAHYQLVLGDDRTKNYRLPIEDAYIRSASPGELLGIPAPELEYVVFVIRMTLKYCTWDEVAWQALRGRRAGPKRSEREELEHLSVRVDEGRVAFVLNAHLPYVEQGLFADCVEALGSKVSLRHRLRAGRRLEQALQPHARRSRRTDLGLRVWRRLALVVSGRTRRTGKGRLVGGGALVGVIGGDGSGKTTVLAALQRWLGAELDVRLVHLGRPPWSKTTYAVRAVSKAADLSASALARWLRVAPLRRLAAAISDLRPLVWLLCTARDRQHTYRKARRYAADGAIVLCDRYPHPSLTSMEVPLIARRAAERAEGRLVRSLIRLEQRYHRAIASPELLVVLRLDPDIAVLRKRDESPESVRRRGAEIWNIDWRAAGVHVIDASQPEDVVARELKALVWTEIG